jgi:Cu-Zn family superoxide dismutase
MKTILPLVVLALAASGCASMSPPGPAAVASLVPTKDQTARGTVTFTQHGEGVRVTAQLAGLKADAEHGFHVHEKGDCSSGDGMSAGGHFNPAGATHGAQAGAHHAGDMPNVRSDAYGNANVFFEIHGLTVAEGASSLVGRGLVLHRDADDYGTQPAGNAGPRIACAVIRRS